MPNCKTALREAVENQNETTFASHQSIGREDLPISLRTPVLFLREFSAAICTGAERVHYFAQGNDKFTKRPDESHKEKKQG